jgi:leader peptidase (prepilin peptidase) / N-methyltransferase
VSLDALAIALTALAGLVAGLVSPRVIGWLRQPEEEHPGPMPPTFLEVAAARHLARDLSVLGAVLGGLVGWRIGWTPVLAAWAYLTGVCLILGYVDARTRLLPTQLIAPSYGIVGGLLVVAALGDGTFSGLRHAVLGWLVMGGFYFVMWRIGPPGLGYGDVRLSGLLALCLGYLGWGELTTGLYSGFVLGGLSGLVLLVFKRATLKSHLPFGPYMMAGALVALIWGESFGSWYGSR